jgi:hypothetical protein
MSEDSKSGVSDPVAEPNYGYSRTVADMPPGENPATNAGRPPTTGPQEMTVPDIAAGALGTPQSQGAHSAASDAWCIQKALDIYVNSRDYLDSNITLGWERNLYHFRNEHGPATPYVRRDWRRARTFRPKTRANVKAQEAAHAAAAFATQDYLDVKAVDPTNEQQVISAAVNKALLQTRLELVPWNWFITCQGAYQDTKVYGVCISHQYWRYETVKDVVPAFDDTGRPIMAADGKTPMGEEKERTTYDMPCVDLLPPECFLFDPMCDWRNPAQTSPYLCYMMGMYAGDVLDRMNKRHDKTGAPLWRKYSLAQILSASRENVDNRTRRAREGHRRVDPANLNDKASQEFNMVWPHLNISREGGVDVAWWTLGTQLVLTDPVPLTDMYPHLQPGERPFVVGFSVVEAHRNYPDGDVAQIAPLQEEINSIANQRLDNVRLVLNKRYFIRRGSQMDLDSLMRNVPGGGVMTNDPEKDVQVINTPDVTSSAYQEQDRLAQDLDDLVGGFGQSSIAAGGKQMDRAGSMDVLQGAAGAVQDYSIKIFFETWMQPVLRQLVRLEQMYETDHTILAIAAKQTPLWQRFGMDIVTDDILQHNLSVAINVGIGNTDPVKRVQKLTFGVTQVVQLPDMQRRVKSMEIANEIFGALGYKDASRFFMNDQELTTHMKTTPPPPPPPEIAVKMQELQQRKQEADQRNQRETQQAGMDHDWRMKQLQSQDSLEHAKLADTVGIQSGKNKTMRDIAAAKEANRLAEINLKRADAAHDRAANAAKPPKPAGEGGFGGPKKEKPAEKKPEAKPEDHTKPLVDAIAQGHKQLGDHMANLTQALHKHMEGSKAPPAAPSAPKKRRGSATLPSGGKMEFEMDGE